MSRTRQGIKQQLSAELLPMQVSKSRYSFLKHAVCNAHNQSLKQSPQLSIHELTKQLKKQTDLILRVYANNNISKQQVVDALHKIVADLSTRLNNCTIENVNRLSNMVLHILWNNSLFDIAIDFFSKQTGKLTLEQASVKMDQVAMHILTGYADKRFDAQETVYLLTSALMNMQKRIEDRNDMKVAKLTGGVFARLLSNRLEPLLMLFYEAVAQNHGEYFESDKTPCQENTHAVRVCTKVC